MLTRKQMNRLMQVAVHTTAYDIWIGNHEGET